MENGFEGAADLRFRSPFAGRALWAPRLAVHYAVGISFPPVSRAAFPEKFLHPVLVGLGQAFSAELSSKGLKAW